MTDDDVPDFLVALGIPGIVDAHVHFLPDNLQETVWIGVRHHTALPHQPGMLSYLNDHTLRLAEHVPAVIPTFTIYPEPGVGEETARCLAAGGRAVVRAPD